MSDPSYPGDSVQLNPGEPVDIHIDVSGDPANPDVPSVDVGGDPSPTGVDTTTTDPSVDPSHTPAEPTEPATPAPGSTDPTHATADPGEAPSEPVPAGSDIPLDPGLPGDQVHGDAVHELIWAQSQTQDGFCVPVSCGMVVSEMLGRPLDQHFETEMVGAAVDMGLLTQDDKGQWSGMGVDGAVQLLEHYGIPAHTEQGDMSKLETYLDEGRGVILAVDSSELWTGVADDTDPQDAADHAVRITEVDPVHGTVTINDPGLPASQGHGETVPIAVFEDAWRDSGNAMVVTDISAPDSPAADGSSPNVSAPETPAPDLTPTPAQDPTQAPRAAPVAAEPAGAKQQTGPATRVAAGTVGKAGVLVVIAGAGAARLNEWFKHRRKQG